MCEKGRHRHSTDKNPSKLKPSNNNQINQQNTLKNNDKKNISKNQNIFNEYLTSSPLGNNIKKKPPILTSINNNNGNISITKNKRPRNKRLDFNKSFEGKIRTDNILKNFDFLKDEIYMNIRGKNKENKNLVNNSMIINQKNKTMNKNRKNNKSICKTVNNNVLNNKKNIQEENLIIKKLDEKFKSLENNIIDKKYLNDIDHDEIIISSNKSNKYNKYPITSRIKQFRKNNTPSDKLSLIIDENVNNKNNNIKEDSFINIIFNKISNNNFDDDYLLNSSFENNRNDFNIMYTDNYEKSVINDMLSLEIKLIIEKMLEIQKSYHKELNIILGQNNSNSKILKILEEKINFFQKKIFLIKKIKEKRKNKENIYKFLEIYNHNNQHEINKINKNEFILWNNILYNNKKIKDSNKEKLKEIFKKTVFEKYNKIKGKINNIENKIIINLMKKYKYNIKKKENNIKNNNINNIAITTNKYQHKNKNVISTNKHKKVINNNFNNNKKHKKTSSCAQTKPTKYTYFKNNQKLK